VIDFKRPNIDSSSIRSRLRGADPRRVDTSRLKGGFSLPTIELPTIELPKLERPQLPSMPSLPAMGDAAKAAGEAGHAVTDAGRAAAEAVGQAGHAAAATAGDAGRAAASLAADAGHIASSAMSDAGRLIGSALDSAGGRLHDLRSAVGPQPKRQGLGRGVTAVAIAAIVGALAAGAAFFLDPLRGARRRAAIRRRLGRQAELARTGVDLAVDATKRASDRAVEFVRIPIESARDLVGSRNGQSHEDTADTAALVGAGSMSGMAALAESDSDIGNLASASSGSWEPSGEALAAESATSSDSSWAARDSGPIEDDGAAASIYGGRNVISDGGSEDEESRRRAEALGE
jgi:hypothetical protein